MGLGGVVPVSSWGSLCPYGGFGGGPHISGGPHGDLGRGPHISGGVSIYLWGRWGGVPISRGVPIGVLGGGSCILIGVLGGSPYLWGSWGGSCVFIGVLGPHISIEVPQPLLNPHRGSWGGVFVFRGGSYSCSPLFPPPDSPQTTWGCSRVQCCPGCCWGSPNPTKTPQRSPNPSESP